MAEPVKTSKITNVNPTTGKKTEIVREYYGTSENRKIVDRNLTTGEVTKRNIDKGGGTAFIEVRTSKSNATPAVSTPAPVASPTPAPEVSEGEVARAKRVPVVAELLPSGGLRSPSRQVLPDQVGIEGVGEDVLLRVKAGREMPVTEAALVRSGESVPNQRTGVFLAMNKPEVITPIETASESFKKGVAPSGFKEGLSIGYKEGQEGGFGNVFGSPAAQTISKIQARGGGFGAKLGGAVGLAQGSPYVQAVESYYAGGVVVRGVKSVVPVVSRSLPVVGRVAGALGEAKVVQSAGKVYNAASELKYVGGGVRFVAGTARTTAKLGATAVSADLISEGASRLSFDESMRASVRASGGYGEFKEGFKGVNERVSSRLGEGAGFDVLGYKVTPSGVLESVPGVRLLNPATKKIFEEEARSEGLSRGLRGEELQGFVSAQKRLRTGKGLGEAGGVLAVSTGSEVAGELGAAYNFLRGGGVKFSVEESKGVLTRKVFAPIACAGFSEGVAVTYSQLLREGKSFGEASGEKISVAGYKVPTVLAGGALGAGSASLIGTFGIVRYSVSNPKFSGAVEKLSYFVDPYEKPGDVIAGAYLKASGKQRPVIYGKPKGVRTLSVGGEGGKGGKSGVGVFSFTPVNVKTSSSVPVSVSIPTESSIPAVVDIRNNIDVNLRESINVNSDVNVPVDVPSNIPNFTTSTNTNENVNVPVNVALNVPTSIPINTAFPRLFPPFLPISLGGGGSGGGKKESKKYADELSAALGTIRGSRRKEMKSGKGLGKRKVFNPQKYLKSQFSFLKLKG